MDSLCKACTYGNQIAIGIDDNIASLRFMIDRQDILSGFLLHVHAILRDWRYVCSALVICS